MEKKQLSALNLFDTHLLGIVSFINESDRQKYKKAFKFAKALEKEQMLLFASKVLDQAECSFTGHVTLSESLSDIYEKNYGNETN